MTPIHSLPKIRKPRERALSEGVASLSLEEVLALVLGSGSSSLGVLELASQVAQVLDSGPVTLSRLLEIPGLGQAKALSILASLRLTELLPPSLVRKELSNPESIYAACTDLLAFPQEHLVVFYLTIRNGSLGRETVSLGTATSSLIHPREVFRPAIIHNASHIVLAHNHPSGDPTPSAADRSVTRRIAEAGEWVGISLVDHVVCATNGYVSLRSDAPELFFS